MEKSSCSRPPRTKRFEQPGRCLCLAAALTAAILSRPLVETFALPSTALRTGAIAHPTVVRENKIEEMTFGYQLPREAKIYRSVEVVGKNRKLRPVISTEQQRIFDRYRYHWIAKHPYRPKEEVLDLSIPGEVQAATKREEELRRLLRQGEIPSIQQFEDVGKVFAARSVDSMRYMSMQRREFIRRAKGWAAEMLMQELEPTAGLIQMLMKGFAATGDVAGAKFWMTWLERNGRTPGRFHYNCIIEAFGAEARPQEALHWFEKMQEAGFLPDVRTYAGIVEAWEHIGNRVAMLNVILSMKDAEAEGQLGTPIHETDVSLPYLALARSYAQSGDAQRAIAVLKLIKDKGLPMTVEAYRIRLLTFLKVPRIRRDVGKIEEAFRDLLANRPKSGTLMVKKLAEEVEKAIGEDSYKEMLRQADVSENEVFAEMTGLEAAKKWRKHNILAALKLSLKKFGRPLTVAGKGVLRSSEDESFRFRNRQNALRGPKMGKIKVGVRRHNPNFGKMPEWMTLPQPVRYGE